MRGLCAKRRGFAVGHSGLRGFHFGSQHRKIGEALAVGLDLGKFRDHGGDFAFQPG